MTLIKKCIAEFIGTFAIVFAGCGAVLVNQIQAGAIGHAGIAATFGLTVMVMIYAVGHISGAHFNPAVTIAFSIGRHFPPAQILPYILAQSLGALAGSATLWVTLKGLFLQRLPGQTMNMGVTLPADGMFMTALVWEIILTFMLMFVIMAVATDYRAVGQAAGIAIGGTVLLNAMFAGSVCGASMNPARSLGPALIAGNWNHLFAYILGPVVGAVGGALIYNMIRCHESDRTDVKGCC